MRNIRIIPAILPYSSEELENKLALVDKIVDRVQIDVVGKAFSSQVTVGIEALENINTSAVLDVQLMVREPVTFLNRCDSGGVDRVFGHIEYMKDKMKFIEHAFALGMQVGIGLDLPTPISEIVEVISEVDAVLLMSVAAGKSGQKNFDRRVLEKIGQVRQLREDISVCIDGGITPANIKDCIDLGAQEFAVGSYLWESKDIVKAIKELKENC